MWWLLNIALSFIKYVSIVNLSVFYVCVCVGYQLTSAECFDLRSSRVVVDQYCHYYPENIKPKPKLQECNMEPCLARWDTRPPPYHNTSITTDIHVHDLPTAICIILISEPILSFSDGYKQIMPYDLYHPLPRYVPPTVTTSTTHVLTSPSVTLW